MTDIFKTKSEDLKLHIFYAGNYYNNNYHEHKLHSLLLRLKLFDSALITMLRMSKNHLITREKVDLFTKGLLTDDSHSLNKFDGGNSAFKRYGKAVGITTLTGLGDDLEYFFNKIKLGNYSKHFEETKSYFLPQLNESEMELIDMKDETHLLTYSKYHEWIYPKKREAPIIGTRILDELSPVQENPVRKNPDIDENEMKLSDSKYKYVNCSCERTTFLIDRNNYEKSYDYVDHRLQKLFHLPSNKKRLSKKKKKCQII